MNAKSTENEIKNGIANNESETVSDNLNYEKVPDELVESIARKVLEQYRAAFEELAKW